MSSHRPRLPISTRHAFALAFDLAARRDPLQSLLVPLLLQAPWILALAVLPPLKDAERPWQVFGVWLCAQIGNFVIWLIVSAMLRFRARSVFNTPAEIPPAPVIDCYSKGLKRVPWLLLTEVVRNISLVIATFFFIVPAVFLGFRLSFATESVVLDEPHMAGSFQRSFQLTEGRFERWLEMIVVSVMLVFCGAFVGAVLSLLFPAPGINVWVAVTQLLIIAMMPIIQYAWTFFYLRLVESDHPLPAGAGVPPAYAVSGMVPAAAVATLADPGIATPDAGPSDRTEPLGASPLAGTEPFAAAAPATGGESHAGGNSHAGAESLPQA